MARSPALAFLLDYLGGDYQLGLLRGVEDAAAEAGLNLFAVVGRSIHTSNAVEAAQSEIYRRIGPSSVDGVIVAAGCLGHQAGMDEIGEFCRRFGAVARCSISAALPGIPSITISNRRGMQAIVDHVLRAHGRRRVAYVRGPEGGEEAQARLEGYIAALEEHGIVFDPGLVQTGDFWIHSGAAAATRLLDDGTPFDALVAANDYMALGALETLRARGVRVPQEVIVAGFDDVPSARIASPSLTTVRQPLHRLGQLGVETIRRQLAGERPEDHVELDVELVTRQSCGCGYRSNHGTDAAPVAVPVRGAWSGLAAHRDPLRATLRRCIPYAPQSFGDWADGLLDALDAELRGEGDRFLRALEEILDRAQPRGELIAQFNAVVVTLRAYFKRVVIVSDRSEGSLGQRLEDLWYSATLLVGNAATRSQMRVIFDADRAQDVLRASMERLSTALSHGTLIQSLREVLPPMGIRSVAMSLYQDSADRSTLVPFFVWRHDDAGAPTPSAPFPSSDLAPPGFFSQIQRWSHIVMPLAFGKSHYGVGVFESGEHPSLYRALRDQIAASLESAELHRAVVQQTELRERAERQHLQTEALIAQQIQTAILPRAMSVEGLDLAAIMVPAAEVGGDYYDVLPTKTGCWIGIGDVTGHGLLSGLVMLMIQGFVAGMLAVNDDAEPSALVSTLNSVLYKNVHDRMQRDEQATLLLLRFERDGRIAYAGFHEEILVVRARTGRCDRLATSGFWLAATRDVSALTTTSTAKLENGDLLVLFTDGVVEAVDSHRKEFGGDRLCALLEAQRSRPVGEICSAVVEAVRNWSPSPADDITVLVGRYAAVGSDRAV
jgi:DNA-binding LacI/PurR family transcriptional regulator/serine phosphatase RsbU (regulator of sigma subunit)